MQFNNKTFNIGDKIQCETDRDEIFTGYITAFIDSNTILYTDEDSGTARKALAAWCEVIYDCDDCQDTGELSVDELDKDSMRYMNGVGVQTCHCKQSSLFDERE
jgi:hypothetical protein